MGLPSVPAFLTTLEVSVEKGRLKVTQPEPERGRAEKGERCSGGGKKQTGREKEKDLDADRMGEGWRE